MDQENALNVVLVNFQKLLVLMHVDHVPLVVSPTVPNHHPVLLALSKHPMLHKGNRVVHHAPLVNFKTCQVNLPVVIVMLVDIHYPVLMDVLNVKQENSVLKRVKLNNVIHVPRVDPIMTRVK